MTFTPRQYANVSTMSSPTIEAELSEIDRAFYAMSADDPIPFDALTRRNALAMEIVRRRVPATLKGLERNR